MLYIIKVKNKILNNTFVYVLKIKENEGYLQIENHNSISTYTNCFSLTCLLV